MRVGIEPRTVKSELLRLTRNLSEVPRQIMPTVKNTLKRKALCSRFYSDSYVIVFSLLSGHLGCNFASLCKASSEMYGL